MGVSGVNIGMAIYVICQVLVEWYHEELTLATFVVAVLAIILSGLTTVYTLMNFGENVSWESHVFGAIGGGVAALAYRYLGVEKCCGGCYFYLDRLLATCCCESCAKHFRPLEKPEQAEEDPDADKPEEDLDSESGAKLDFEAFELDEESGHDWGANWQQDEVR